MHPIYSLSQQLKEKEVGHKAYQLSCVFKTFNVPPAFILTTYHLDYFLQPILDKINELLNEIKQKGIEKEHSENESESNEKQDDEKECEEKEALIQTNANKIQELVISTPFANDLKYQILEYYSSLNIQKELDRMIQKQNLPLVAVRPSSFLPSNSQCHFSLLNIKGENEVLDAIRICWASLFTKKSIEMHINKDTPFSMGVIIHKMISADLSGDAFFEGDKICVRGAYGLGEVIQKNLIQPDVYLLKKESLDIVKRAIAEQDIKLVTSHYDKTTTIELGTQEARSQKFKDKHIKEAAQLCKRVANFLKQDIENIEFCIRDDKLYLLQVDVHLQEPEENKGKVEESKEHEQAEAFDTIQSSASSISNSISNQSFLSNDAENTKENNESHDDYSIHAQEEGDSLYLGDESHIYNPEDDLFDAEEEMKVVSTMSNDSSKVAYGAYNVSQNKSDLHERKSTKKDNSKDGSDNVGDGSDVEKGEEIGDVNDAVESKHEETESDESKSNSDSEKSENGSKDDEVYLTDEEQKEYEKARDEYYEDRKTLKENYYDDGAFNIENENSYKDENLDAELDAEKEEDAEEQESTNLHINQDNLSEGELYVHEEMLLNGRHFIISCFDLVNKKLRDFHYEKTKYDGDLDFTRLIDDLRDYIEDKDVLLELYEIYLRIEKKDEVTQLAEVSAVAHTAQSFINTFPKH